MIHKTIGITIGLALFLIAVISAVPMSQKVYAAGSPGVGSVGGSGSGNSQLSGGNLLGIVGFGGSSSSGAVGGLANSNGFGEGTTGGPGSGFGSSNSGGQSCSPSLFNCGGGAGLLNSGGSGAGVPINIPNQGGTGGNGVGPGGAP